MLDRDGDGEVSLLELCQVVQSSCVASYWNVLICSPYFKMYVTFEHLLCLTKHHFGCIWYRGHQVLKDASIPITKEVTDSFWELDADGSGNVSLDTLMSFWKHNVHAEPVSSHSRSPSAERLHNSIHKSAISMVRYSYAKSIAGTRS